MSDDTTSGCPHCPDGHADPTSRPWGVFVSMERDGDGQPTHLCAMPTAGQHVAESDAEWARRMLNQHVFVEQVARALRDHTRIDGIHGDCSCGHVVPLGHSFAQHQATALHASIFEEGS